MWWHRQLFHPRHTPKISVCSFINRHRENKCAVNVKMFGFRLANSLVSIPPAKLHMELSCPRHLGEVYWELLSICKMSTNIATVVSSDDLHPANKAIQPHALYHASLEQASPWRSGGFKVPCFCWLATQDRMGQGCSISSGNVGFHETVMHTAAMVKTVSFSQIKLECHSFLQNIL